jgi:hypothetical protein
MHVVLRALRRSTPTPSVCSIAGGQLPLASHAAPAAAPSLTSISTVMRSASQGARVPCSAASTTSAGLVWTPGTASASLWPRPPHPALLSNRRRLFTRALSGPGRSSSLVSEATPRTLSVAAVEVLPPPEQLKLAEELAVAVVEAETVPLVPLSVAASPSASGTSLTFPAGGALASAANAAHSASTSGAASSPSAAPPRPTNSLAEAAAASASAEKARAAGAAAAAAASARAAAGPTLSNPPLRPLPPPPPSRGKQPAAALPPPPQRPPRVATASPGAPPSRLGKAPPQLPLSPAAAAAGGLRGGSGASRPGARVAARLVAGGQAASGAWGGGSGYDSDTVRAGAWTHTGLGSEQRLQPGTPPSLAAVACQFLLGACMHGSDVTCGVRCSSFLVAVTALVVAGHPRV